MALNLTKDFVFDTIQGEGKYVGFPSTFIRLTGCNLRCKWQNADGSTTLCDTPYSSHHPESLESSIEEVIKAVKEFNSEHVVITGGEPYLQEGLTDLVLALKDLGKIVTIETNATVFLPTKADFISMSPKLSSSQVDAKAEFKQAVNLDIIRLFIGSGADWQLKFVLNEENDIAEIAEIVSALDVNDGVYLMPQAITKSQLEERADWVMDVAKKHGWLYCDRLHIRQWGARRKK